MEALFQVTLQHSVSVLSIQPKILELSESETNGTEVFLESFCKILDFWIFKMISIQLKIQETPTEKSNGTILGTKFFKIWVYLTRLSSLLEILENTVLFTAANFQKFTLKFLVEWKVPKAKQNY